MRRSSDRADARFEKMDQRFEKIDERFEKMDQRFEVVETTLRDLARWSCSPAESRRRSSTAPRTRASTPSSNDSTRSKKAQATELS